MTEARNGCGLLFYYLLLVDPSVGRSALPPVNLHHQRHDQ